MEQREEQAKPVSPVTNVTIPNMLAAMEYTSGMSLGKNPHFIVLRPTSKSNLKAA
jgi:hypothetical protein